MLGRFRNWVEHMEQLPISMATLAGVLVAVISVRNFVEILVAGNPIYPGPASFVHYPLAYIGPFLALTVTLSLGSRVPPSRVGRLMMFAWLLTLIPPVVDLFLGHDVETPAIGYLFVDTGDLPWTWLHFFDPTASFVGTTAGIRVEAFAAVVLGAFYVWLRSASLLRAAATAVGVYVVSLFFFTLPALVLAAMQTVLRETDWDGFWRGEGVLLRSVKASSEDSIAIMWLVPVCLLLALAWAWQERRLTGETSPKSERPLAGAGAFLTFAGLAGIMSGAAMHFGTRRPNIASYDVLALVGFALAIGLLARVFQAFASERKGVDFLLAGAGIALLCGLGRAVSVGVLAATAPLLVVSAPALPSWIRKALVVPVLAVTTLCAYGAGIALVVGDHALARMPDALNPMLLIGGAAFGAAWLLRRTVRGWPIPLVLGLGFALAAATQGSTQLALIALGGGAVGGLVGRFADVAWSGRVMAGWTGLLVGIASFQLFFGAIAQPDRQQELHHTFRCNPRLELLNGAEKMRTEGWKIAQTSYRRALQCDENYLPAVRELARGMIEYDQDLRRAVPMLEQAAEKFPDEFGVLNDLAAAYLRQNEFDKALAVVERAVAIAPREPDVMFNHALALGGAKRTQEAVDAWKLYLDRTEWRTDLARLRLQAQRQLRQQELRLASSPQS